MTEEIKLARKIGRNIKITQINVSSGAINYVKTGRGKPLLLIHGANIGWGQWYKNIYELSKRRTVYAIDLPGSGGSIKLDYKTMDFDRDIIDQVIKFIIEAKINYLDIIGHSIGAYVALKICLEKSITCNRLVLTEPLGLTSKMPNIYRPLSFYPFAYLLSRTVMNTSASKIRNFLISSVRDRRSIDESFINYCIESLNRDQPHPTILLMHRISGFFAIKKQFVLTDKFSKLTIPTLVIMGKYDPMISAQEVQNVCENYSNVEFSVYKNSAHLPFIEETEKFNKAVSNFLIA